MDPIAQAGLAVTDFSGLKKAVSAGHVQCSEDPSVLAGADLVIVAVKTSATAAMGQQIALHAPPYSPVFSFQNGMGNATLLQQMLPGRDVRAAMVPFNVVTPEMPAPLSKQMEGQESSPSGDQSPAVAQPVFHRASSGNIVIAAGPGHWGRRLSVPGLAVVESADISGVQWGKLLINLNNALNALSGVP